MIQRMLASLSKPPTFPHRKITELENTLTTLTNEFKAKESSEATVSQLLHIEWYLRGNFCAAN